MDHREKKKAFKKEEATKFINSLPMSFDLFQGLFRFLDKQISDDPDSTFDLTKQFCDSNGIDFKTLKAWLIEHGAGDDVEILWNIEEKFENQ